MTQEEKQVLFIDLCARLPYGAVIHTDWKDVKLDHDHCGIGMLYYEHYSEEAKKECGYDENDCSIIISGCYYGDIKPYLRPMSTMTEEEKMQLKEEHLKDARLFAEALTKAAEGDNSMRGKVIPHFAADWCYKNHFDFRGLIPMGLALEAPADMYKTE